MQFSAISLAEVGEPNGSFHFDPNGAIGSARLAGLNQRFISSASPSPANALGFRRVVVNRRHHVGVGVVAFEQVKWRYRGANG